MLLTVLDPALLVYRYADWRVREDHCLRRFAALTLHRRMIREYGQKLAMSDGFAAVIQQCFPWNSDCQGVPELRDLRQFFFHELGRAHYVRTLFSGKADIEPQRVVCQLVEGDDVVACWVKLVCSCVIEAAASDFQPQIGTWDTSDARATSGHVALTIVECDAGGTAIAYHVPLVWDRDTWASQLATQDWWPDLHRCVEFYFAASPDMRQYRGTRREPLKFECTAAFCKSADRHCREDQSIRRALIKALTKKVHGIQDSGLGDERFRKVRRFRVTGDFRVHYLDEDGVLVLLEFGHHDVGGA